VHPANSTVPNATTDGPAELLRHFHEDIHVRFGGIRKPRTYSHVALSNDSGWLLPDAWSVGAGSNNWDMSSQAWADFYIGGHAHFLQDGVDFWWRVAVMAATHGQPDATTWGRGL
jgi:hypothetical protein